MQTTLERLDSAVGEAEMKVTEQVMRIAAMQTRKADTKLAVQTLVTLEETLIECLHTRNLLIETMRLSEDG